VSLYPKIPVTSPNNIENIGIDAPIAQDANTPRTQIQFLVNTVFIVLEREIE